MMHKIQIAELNGSGHIKHLQELVVFSRNKKIDVCLGAETHFTKKHSLK